MSDAPGRAYVLSVDDDPDIRDLVERVLSGAGFEVAVAASGPSGIAAARQRRPDLILLDVMMPGMTGYEVCSELQCDLSLATVPVVFVTALGDEQDKSTAFSLGAVDYFVKPFKPAELVRCVKTHAGTAVRWDAIATEEQNWADRLVPSEFVRFKEWLVEKLPDPATARTALDPLRPTEVYESVGRLGVSPARLAELIARFMEVDLLDEIEPADIDLGVLPAPFCRKNLVVPVTTAKGSGLVVANPFNWELLDTIERFSAHKKPYRLMVAEPRVILGLLTAQTDKARGAPSDDEEVHSFMPEATLARRSIEQLADEEDDEGYGPVTVIANNMISAAVTQRASDIHIEPKEKTAVVRFRIDGDLRDFVTLKRRTAAMLISRLKALAGLDIAEKRKPQDGSLEAVVQNRRYKLRLATTSTPSGESLIMRLLEVTADAKRLEELGLAPEQADRLRGFAQRGAGLILIVGMTGSGKTTTIYSLLSTVDADRRSILTIEDPVEYRIPLANQQQVNDKAGVTFETLLRSVVRQDPDVLFLGEIRDPYSAKMSMDFASTGHLTITSLHTTNATTAIFRLERLGVSRPVMAEAVLGIVAQRLVKRLCPACRVVSPITPEERLWFEPFTDDVPESVAHPGACDECDGTGYVGRETVNEVFEFDSEIQEMLRRDAPVAEIREFARSRGDYLIFDHAIDKVRAFVFAPKDVYERVLVEEVQTLAAARAAAVAGGAPPDLDEALPDAPSPLAADTPVVRPARETPARSGPREAPAIVPSILLVEDSEDSRLFVTRVLERAGYDVTPAGDGPAALIELARQPFDLMLADINIPMLDGFALLEVMHQQDIRTPVALLTARDTEEDEARARGLGAVDFIRKPVRQQELLARVKAIVGI